jgi:hypothetical protein
MIKILNDFQLHMEDLSVEELQRKAKEHALASQEHTTNAKQYYLEIQKRQNEEAEREIRNDVAEFRKNVDKFIETAFTLSSDMKELDKQINNLETKYGMDAFTIDEKQLFYSMKIGSVFFKAVQLSKK